MHSIPKRSTHHQAIRKRGLGTVKRYGPQALSERITTGWREKAKEKRHDRGALLSMGKEPKPEPDPKPRPQPRDNVGSRSPASSEDLGA